MSRRITSAHRLYEAVRKAESAGRGDGLPREIHKRFEAQFEGIRLPSNARTRERFLEAVTGISNNIFLHGTVTLSKLERALRDDSPFSSFLLERRCETAEMRLADVAKAIKLAGKSSKRMRYAQFLARQGFDLDSFIRTAEIFAGERKITFSDVPEETLEVGRRILELLKDRTDAALSNLASVVVEFFQRIKSELLDEGDSGEIEQLAISLATSPAHGILCLMLNDEKKALEILKREFPEACRRYEEEAEEQNVAEPWARCDYSAAVLLLDCGIFPYQEEGGYDFVIFHKSFELEDLRGFITNEQKFLEERGLDGIVFGNKMLLKSDEESLIQHELQHLFDILILMDDEHVGHEHRATLASLAFSEDPLNAFERFQTLRTGFLPELIREGGRIDSPHFQARKIIARQLIGSGIDINEMLLFEELSPEDVARISSVSMKLLNKEYKRKCGLTYDEILQPFRTER